MKYIFIFLFFFKREKKKVTLEKNKYLRQLKFLP